MDQTLENYFEELMLKVKDFSDLRNYKIKLERVIWGGYVFSVKTLKNPANLEFIVGESFGYISVVTPFVLVTYLSFGWVSNLPLLMPIYFFFILWRFIGYRKIERDFKKCVDCDFVVRSDKKSLAHELGHIHFHREALTNPKSNKGFRNGLKFFFNRNARWDLEIEEFLEVHGLHSLGRFNILILRYINKTGDIYRRFRII